MPGGHQIVQTLIENLPLILDAALQLITGLAQGILNALPGADCGSAGNHQRHCDLLLDSIPQIIETGIQLLTSLVGGFAGHHYRHRGSDPPDY